jgi:hypothetical protein
LKDDLAAPEYGFARETLIQLEKKEDMKKRGLASPDKGDALALTFAFPILKKVTRQALRTGGRRNTYNPLDFRP